MTTRFAMLAFQSYIEMKMSDEIYYSRKWKINLI